MNVLLSNPKLFIENERFWNREGSKAVTTRMRAKTRMFMADLGMASVSQIVSTKPRHRSDLPTDIAVVHRPRNSN